MSASSTAQRLNQSEAQLGLRRAIERLATPAGALDTKAGMTASDFGTLIDMVSREVDETVLPRKMALCSDDTPVAVLILSNRRFLELHIDGRKIEPDGEADASPDIIAGVYAKALKALCVRSETLTLRRLGRAPHAMAQGAMCSARHLAVFSETSDFENRLKVFLKEIHPATLGWIFQKGTDEPLAYDPDKEVFDRLAALQQKARSAAKPRNGLRQLNRNTPQCATFAISDDHHAMIISDGNDLLIAAVPHQDVSAALDQWSAMYRRSAPGSRT